MDAIKELRLKNGVTQTQLASKIGVTQSLIAQWERGATQPSASKLPTLASALGCTIDELFGRDNTPASGG